MANTIQPQSLREIALRPDYYSLFPQKMLLRLRFHFSPIGCIRSHRRHMHAGRALITYIFLFLKPRGCLQLDRCHLVGKICPRYWFQHMFCNMIHSSVSAWTLLTLRFMGTITMRKSVFSPGSDMISQEKLI